jgi:hypothetical protein
MKLHNSLDLERKKTAFASTGRPESISNCYSISCRSRSAPIWILSTAFLYRSDRGDPPHYNTLDVRCTIRTSSHEQAAAARQIAPDARNQEETPNFTVSIERHALKRSPKA